MSIYRFNLNFHVIFVIFNIQEKFADWSLPSVVFVVISRLNLALLGFPKAVIRMFFSHY